MWDFRLKLTSFVDKWERMGFITKYVNRRSQDGAVGGPGYSGSIPGRGKRSISSSKTRVGLRPTQSRNQWVRVAPFAGGKAGGREFAFVTCTEASSPLLPYDNKFAMFPYYCYRS